MQGLTRPFLNGGSHVGKRMLSTVMNKPFKVKNINIPRVQSIGVEDLKLGDGKLPPSELTGSVNLLQEQIAKKPDFQQLQLIDEYISKLEQVQASPLRASTKEYLQRRVLLLAVKLNE